MVTAGRNNTRPFRTVLAPGADSRCERRCGRGPSILWLSLIIGALTHSRCKPRRVGGVEALVRQLFTALSVATMTVTDRLPQNVDNQRQQLLITQWLAPCAPNFVHCQFATRASQSPARRLIGHLTGPRMTHTTHWCASSRTCRWDCPSMPRHAACRTPGARSDWGFRTDERAVPSAAVDRRMRRIPCVREHQVVRADQLQASVRRRFVNHNLADAWRPTRLADTRDPFT